MEACDRLRALKQQLKSPAAFCVAWPPSIPVRMPTVPTLADACWAWLHGAQRSIAGVLPTAMDRADRDSFVT